MGRGAVTGAAYLSKPTLVDAVQLTASNAADIVAWCGTGPRGNPRAYRNRAGVNVRNGSGLSPLTEGKWLVRDEQDLLHVLSDDHFQLNFQKVGP